MVGHLLVVTALAAASATTMVQLGHDGVDSLLNLLLLLIEVILVSILVLLTPLGGGLDNSLKSLLVIVGELVLDLLLIVDGVLDVVDVRLQRVLGVDLLLEGLLLEEALVLHVMHVLNDATFLLN